MKGNNLWITILAVIAIILSIVAIYISLNKDNSSNNYVTRGELNQEHALISTALQNSRKDLDEYNLCIRRAVSAYANCDQTTEQPESFNICYNNLNANMAGCDSPNS